MERHTHTHTHATYTYERRKTNTVTPQFGIQQSSLVKCAWEFVRQPGEIQRSSYDIVERRSICRRKSTTFTFNMRPWDTFTSELRGILVVQKIVGQKKKRSSFLYFYFYFFQIGEMFVLTAVCRIRNAPAVKDDKVCCCIMACNQVKTRKILKRIIITNKREWGKKEEVDEKEEKKNIYTHLH